MTPHRVPCGNPDCPVDEAVAEGRASTTSATYASDAERGWQRDQDAYERGLDRMGGSL